MGKPGDKNQSKISNIYGRIPGAQDISKECEIWSMRWQKGAFDTMPAFIERELDK